MFLVYFMEVPTYSVMTWHKYACMIMYGSQVAGTLQLSFVPFSIDTLQKATVVTEKGSPAIPSGFEKTQDTARYSQLTLLIHSAIVCNFSL